MACGGLYGVSQGKQLRSVSKILEGRQSTESRRRLPYDVVIADSEANGGDGAIQLVSRLGESLSSPASIFSTVGGVPGLNWRERRSWGEKSPESSVSAHHPSSSHNSVPTTPGQPLKALVAAVRAAVFP